MRFSKTQISRYPFAGKSTLVDTMRSIKEQQLASPHEPGEPTNPGVSELSIHNCAGQKEGARTRGIEVVQLMDEEDLRISAWDFAGQQEYYALHDCVFPDTNGSTIFLFARKPLDGATLANRVKHLRQQLEYWLRFISSNSRPEHTSKPMVVVVITHQDQAATKLNYMDVQRSVKEVAGKFGNLVRVETGRIFLLDATAQKEVTGLLGVIETKFKQSLLDLEEVPAICELTLSALGVWAKNAGGNPIMTVEKFNDMVEVICETEL